MTSNNSQFKYLLECKKYSRKMVIKQHNFTKEQYLLQMVNDLLFNEKSHLVSKFKDHLIYNDSSEFLKRYYKKKETKRKLYRILDYYERSSRVFPNYTVLYESKYIYKNIQKKQKVIDEIQQMDEENKERHIKYSRNNQYKESFKLTEIFNTEACELINQPSKTDYIGLDIFNEANKNNELIENEEMLLFDKIVNKIENEEKKQLSRLRMQTEYDQKKNLNSNSSYSSSNPNNRQLPNMKNILITQTFKLKKLSTQNDKKENESLNMNTSYKGIDTTRPHHSKTMRSNQTNSKAHRILKSCVFGFHQKNISSISSMRSQNSNGNSTNASKLLNSNYVKTESSLSPNQKILLSSETTSLYTTKYDTTSKHSQFKKIAPQKSQHDPRNITSRERVQPHLITITSPIAKKLAIPIISNKSSIKGIHIQNFDNAYQSNNRNIKPINTVPSSNANYQSTLTNRNKYNLKSEDNKPKFQLSWKKLAKSPH